MHGFAHQAKFNNWTVVFNKNVTVGEAVMQLELSGDKILVFRNEGHGGVNVVYRRDDGNIGWIDPRNTN